MNTNGIKLTHLKFFSCANSAERLGETISFSQQLPVFLLFLVVFHCFRNQLFQIIDPGLVGRVST